MNEVLLERVKRIEERLDMFLKLFCFGRGKVNRVEYGLKSAPKLTDVPFAVGHHVRC